jgi:MarR family transcriptional regulator, organic hydroperoxide resistance regulator
MFAMLQSLSVLRDIGEMAVGKLLHRERQRREALLAVRAVIDQMRERYRALERKTGAPITSHRVLAAIAVRPGIGASALAQQLGMNRPAMSQALKSLEERGWISRRRDLGDGRSVQLRLTQSGSQLLRSTVGRASGTLDRCIRALSDAELHAATVGLRAIAKQLSEKSQRRRRAS